MEVWASDGTSGGTRPLGDINIGLGNADPLDFVVVDAQLFFTATDGPVESCGH